MKWTPNKYNPERPPYLDIVNIVPLESIKDKYANEVTVWIDRKFDNKEFFSKLSEFESKSDDDRKGDLNLLLIDYYRFLSVYVLVGNEFFECFYF